MYYICISVLPDVVQHEVKATWVENKSQRTTVISVGAISERDSADSLPSMASYLKGKKRVRRRASVPTKTKGKHKSTSCSLSLRYMVPNNTQHWDYHTFPDKNTYLSWKHLQNAS